jgi:ubiquinone/menaquinone biosynthesis C-methylase UbiE
MDDIIYPDNYFDLILCSMALHAVYSEFHKNTIENIARMLRANGLFVLIDMIKPKFKFLPPLLPARVWSKKNFDLQTISVLLEQAGFVREFNEILNFWIVRQIFRYHN